jgi:thiol-disulfide isomerase/thioredoxin
MSRSRVLFTSAVVVLALGVGFVFAQSDDPNSEILKKLDALEKRIASLESSLNQRLGSMEKAIAKGGGGVPTGPSPQLESQAQAAFGKINGLISAGKYEEAKTEMDGFMKQYAGTNTARQASRLNRELAVIGKSAPTDWGIDQWYQGESDVDLASDKTTLVVFWEVWCPHCKREVPKLQKIYADLKGEGLQVVGLTKLTRSSTEEGVKAFVSEQSVGYPIAKENGSASAWFGVSGIPAAAVVKDGKVIWRGHPARLSEDMLKGWL